jgi:enoyl-[acyl-carrier-protein] reductase (NADH)
MLNSDNAPRWRTEVGFMREIAWHYAKTWKTTGREIVIHYTIDRVRARLTACDIECDIEMSFENEEEVQVSLSEMWN